MAFQFRRGTDAERQSITPKPGEPLYVTDTGQVYVGDGTTQGGNLVSISVSDDDSPSLGGNLDLNGNDIIGTGNINIDGFITATGNINLGDGAEDNIIVGGVIESSLIPGKDNTYDLGANTFAWRNGFFNGLSVDGEILSQSLSTDIIYSTDSTILWDTTTDTINASSIVTDSIQGDVIGSVFGDNSSVLVDANDNSLHTDTLEIRSNSILLTDGFELIFDKTKSALAVWEEVDSEVTNAPRFSTRASRTSGESITSVTSGDVVAANIGTMFDGQDFVLSSAIATTVDQQTGTNTLPTRLDIFLAGADGQQISAFRVNSRGTASASVFKTGSYEDEDERDSLIPSPEPGMIILLTGHNDSTGVPKFQGYNGTQWIDFT